MTVVKEKIYNTPYHKLMQAIIWETGKKGSPDAPTPITDEGKKIFNGILKKFGVEDILETLFGLSGKPPEKSSVSAKRLGVEAKKITKMKTDALKVLSGASVYRKLELGCPLFAFQLQELIIARKNQEDAIKRDDIFRVLG